ncbi:hypothetical protein [Leifsonia sp. AG29]|uniref:hypothetical protein n=1 Tax=Leifsonia sp. AG29 TaxID=2598860 RepID=UPI00131ECD71|nr:hypothetical protein [Leifsonia sp. AG29]
MNAGPSTRNDDIKQEIPACESRTADQIATLRLLEQEWERYREVMRLDAARYEEAGHAIGEKDYGVARGLAARREVDAYVRQLANELEELVDEGARQMRAEAETERERLRGGRAGESWD